MTTWTLTAAAAVTRDAVERLLGEAGEPVSFVHPDQLQTHQPLPLMAV